MSMETALRARMKDDAAVAAIVGSRIDWGVRPQGSILPAIVLTNVFDDRSQHMAGFIAARQTRVQIDCYAATKAAAVELREAVIAAVVPPASKSGVTFQRAQGISVLDRGEHTEAGFIHRELIDLQIWHDA